MGASGAVVSLEVPEVLHPGPEPRCACGHLLPLREPEPDWAAWVVRGNVAPEPGTVDALARHLASDPDLLSVQSMVNMVDLVSAFGPLDRGHTLGHHAVLDRIGVYVAKYQCPACHPWEFGMARTYLASALARGTSRFDEATELLRWTRDVLRASDMGKGAAALAEVLEWLGVTLKSVGRRERHPWFY